MSRLSGVLLLTATACAQAITLRTVAPFCALEAQKLRAPDRVAGWALVQADGKREGITVRFDDDTLHCNATAVVIGGKA